MSKHEKLAIVLRPGDTEFLDRVAQEKGVSRSAVVRWAIDQYRLFLLPQSSTYRIFQDNEGNSIPADSAVDENTSYKAINQQRIERIRKAISDEIDELQAEQRAIKSANTPA